jgi:hypothetical protein
MCSDMAQTYHREKTLAKKPQVVDTPSMEILRAPDRERAPSSQESIPTGTVP